MGWVGPAISSNRDAGNLLTRLLRSAGHLNHTVFNDLTAYDYGDPAFNVYACLFYAWETDAKHH